MSARELHCGFLPLVDSATVIIAKEIGFAADENIDLVLHKEPNWSLIRDKLAFGALDVALVLSPMPIAASLGLGGVNERIDVLSVGSINGNVIGFSGSLAKEFAGQPDLLDFNSPTALGQALAATGRTIRFGVPFPFSMHKELILYWLESTGFDVHKRLEIKTIPPPLMADAIESEEVDAFCVGEPWGSVTVGQTDARLVLPGASIWQSAPEKVLAARYRWITDNYSKAGAIFRATLQAARWIADPGNLTTVSEILARPEYLNLSTEIIDRSLTGRLMLDAFGAEAKSSRFVEFYEHQARFPWRSQAIWIADRLSARHGVDRATARRVARDCFRTDLYREFIATLGDDAPGASEKVEGLLFEPTAVGSAKGKIVLGPDAFFDQSEFDPSAFEN